MEQNSLELSHHIYSQLIFDEDEKVTQWRKYCLSNKWCWNSLISISKKYKLQFTLHTIHKKENSSFFFMVCRKDKSRSRLGWTLVHELHLNVYTREKIKKKLDGGDNIVLYAIHPNSVLVSGKKLLRLCHEENSVLTMRKQILTSSSHLSKGNYANILKERRYYLQVLLNEHLTPWDSALPHPTTMQNFANY